MASVSFQCAEGVERFSVCDAQGHDVSVEAGKNFSTSDPALIRELDAHPHAVRRVKPKKEEGE